MIYLAAFSHAPNSSLDVQHQVPPMLPKFSTEVPRFWTRLPMVHEVTQQSFLQRPTRHLLPAVLQQACPHLKIHESHLSDNPFFMVSICTHLSSYKTHYMEGWLER